VQEQEVACRNLPLLPLSPTRSHLSYLWRCMQNWVYSKEDRVSYKYLEVTGYGDMEKSQELRRCVRNLAAFSTKHPDPMGAPSEHALCLHTSSASQFLQGCSRTAAVLLQLCRPLAIVTNLLKGPRTAADLLQLSMLARMPQNCCRPLATVNACKDAPELLQPGATLIQSPCHIGLQNPDVFTA